MRADRAPAVTYFAPHNDTFCAQIVQEAWGRLQRDHRCLDRVIPERLVPERIEAKDGYPSFSEGSRSQRWHHPEMAGPFNKLDHMFCGVDRDGMLGKTRSWRNIGGHFANMLKLPISAFGEQGKHHIL